MKKVRKNAVEKYTTVRTIRMGDEEWRALRKIAVQHNFHSAGAAARAGIQYWLGVKYPKLLKKPEMVQTEELVFN